MAFVFTVEDGTGLSTANSYVGISEALDLLYPDTARHTSLDGASSAEQESALALATTYLDTNFTWEGKKYVSTSALRWPRTGACDRDGIAIGNSTIPTKLKYCTALVASLIIADKLNVTDSATSTQDFPLSSIKIDVISLDYAVPDTEFVQGKDVIPSEVTKTLIGLGSPSGGSSAFGRIRK